MSMPPEIGDVVVFTVHEAVYCADLRRIDRVLSLAALDPVPLGPPYLRGLLSVAGRDAPVIDLAERLCLKERRQYNLSTPILLCSVGDMLVGAIVSSVLGVETVHAAESLQLAGRFPPILGVLGTAHGRALLLDLQGILDIDPPPSMVGIDHGAETPP